MKLTVLGVKRIEGNAKATGNPFDMCRLFAMVNVETTATAKIKVEGYGFELAEVMLDPEAIPKFKEVKFPAVLELETDSRPFRGKLETVVVGIRQALRTAANG